MSGLTNYPTSLDDDTSLHDVIDDTTPIVAAHHNNTKEAVKALEERLGIINTSDPDSFEYRAFSATDSHDHRGASGYGKAIEASALFASINSNRRTILTANDTGWQGTVATAGLSPLIVPRTMWIEKVVFAANEGSTGATLRIDLRAGPSTLFTATTEHLMHAPTLGWAFIERDGASGFAMRTIPSGAVIRADFRHAHAASQLFSWGTLEMVFREDEV